MGHNTRLSYGRMSRENDNAEFQIEQTRSKRERELTLVNMGLRSLPESIGDLPRVKRINIALNELTSLPSELGALTQLTRLVASGNKLRSLPFEFENLVNLVELDLTENSFAKLPSQIADMGVLETLKMADNQLDITSARALVPTLLAKLDFARNNLRSSPTTLARS